MSRVMFFVVWVHLGVNFLALLVIMPHEGQVIPLNRYPANVPELIFAKKCPFEALNSDCCHALIFQRILTKLEDQMHKGSNLKYMKKNGLVTRSTRDFYVGTGTYAS